MRIFVGNLSYQTTEDQLTDLFSQVGEVESATIVTDRDTGRSRGFAFIEMDRDAAQKAIQQFNCYELQSTSTKLARALNAAALAAVAVAAVTAVAAAVAVSVGNHDGSSFG